MMETVISAMIFMVNIVKILVMEVVIMTMLLMITTTKNGNDNDDGDDNDHEDVITTTMAMMKTMSMMVTVKTKDENPEVDGKGTLKYLIYIGYVICCSVCFYHSLIGNCYIVLQNLTVAPSPVSGITDIA